MHVAEILLNLAVIAQSSLLYLEKPPLYCKKISIFFEGVLVFVNFAVET